MKVVKVASLLLLGLVLLAPASWSAESAAVPENTDEQAVSEEKKDDALKSSDQASGVETSDPSTASAATEKDPDDEPVTQGDLNGLRTELETLRDQFQTNYDQKTATTSRSLKFGGSATTKFVVSDDPAVKEGFGTPSLNLKFSGNLRKDYEDGKNVDYVFGTNAGGSDLTLRIQDAYLSYSILPSNDVTKPYLYVYVGQQKKIFGLEATASEEYKPTINGAQFTKALSLDERDIGLVLSGDLFPHNDYGFSKYRVPAIAYSIGVVNGSGPNKADDNDNKDVFARVAFNAPVDYNDFLRGLTLGVSGYWGVKTATATRTSTTTVNVPNATPPPATISVTTNTTDTTLSQKGDKNRYGGDLSYVNTPVGFTLEYVRGEDPSLSKEKIKNGTITTPSTFRSVKSEGITFTLFYNFGEQFQKSYKEQTRYGDWYPQTIQPFLRFDRFDPDLDAEDDRKDIYTIGFNWFFAPTTKLQLNYNIVSGQIPKAQKNNEFLAQFQYGF
ncbi:porin [Geotalea uraniireducens]|uniref:Phosphate-selective porin O and P n=1 Tax=Geotalea uraniireducens (strain Rf4) TaxID=351605 RepID=A5G8B8_GEOUR|nr:porin [Geotalea uraniireducens]ABQ28036.1 phosphate-selective porin O and P [Geotalea uraniireducens Rf4]